MLGLGSSLYKAGKIGKSIIRDGLVLKHNYNAGAVEPCSTGAVKLNGTSDYVDTGSAFQSTFRDSFSISTWIKPVDGIEAEISILGTLKGGEDGVRIDILDTGKVRFGFRGNNDDSYSTTNTAVFSDGVNEWTHIACVATKPASGDTELAIYVNGVAITSTLTNATTIENHADYTSDINLILGARLNDTTREREFDGYMCNVGIWSAALTQPQIKSIMLKDYASLSASEKTSLVSWWNLDSAYNLSVLDNHGGGVGEALGGELLVNGDFSNGTNNWTPPTNAVISASNNQLTVDDTADDGSDSRAVQNFPTVNGGLYAVKFNRVSTTSQFWLGIGNGSGYTGIFYSGLGTDTGEYRRTFTATGSSSTIALITSQTGVTVYSEVSVKLINGNTGTLA